MINTTVVHGRLTKDVKSKETNNGKVKASFTLAVKRNYKNKDGEYEADFLKVEALGKQADYIIKNTQKGNRLAVVGRNQTRSYVDEQGVNRIYQYIFANEVDIIDYSQSSDSNDSEAVDIYEEEIDDYDLPF